MLDEKGFNLWANGYDEDVQLSEEKNEYPFAGYKNVLNKIYKIIRRNDRANILDLGFGTGILTKKLYEDGYEIYGIDFSEKMIEIAKEKMPLSKLFKQDFSKNLPQELENIPFDFIISTYAMHHLKTADKVKLIRNVDKHLIEGGKIIIGDIAFKTRGLLDKCRTNYGNYWDEKEVYFVYDEIKDFFPEKDISFIITSHCSGIIQISE